MDHGRRSNSSFIGLIAVCVLVLGISALIVISLDEQTPPRPHGVASPRAQNLSNIKQLGLALAMYSTDYDDRLPFDMSGHAAVMDVVGPYVKNDTVFRSLCPGGGMFQPNAGAGGALSSELTDPQTTVLANDPADWPDGMRALTFADMHAKYVAGFDPEKGLSVGLTPAGEADLKKAREEVAKREKASVDAPAPTNALGMPSQ